MRIIHQDSKTGEIVVIPENLDDIWHLHNIIQPGDLVTALTYRTEEQRGEEGARAKKAEKRRMKLGIRVEKTAFHDFSDRLRIQGNIETGPQDIGSYHTHNITAEDHEKISIQKKEWKNHQLQRLKDAVDHSKSPQVVFLCLDDDSATVAILHQSGVQNITDISSNRSGKMYDSVDTTKTYYDEILHVLSTTMTPDSPLIILGPGFTKEHIAKYGREKQSENFKHTHIHATGNAGMNGISEALKTGCISQITQDNRVAKETHHIQRLLEEIKKDGLVAYGHSEVERALQSGACERLLLTDIHAKTPEGEHLLELAQQTRSNWTIINTHHEAGKTFEGIGGIGAILRFKLN